MNQKKFGKNSLWRRALALLLAVSMVLIPVKFPGHTHAADTGTGSSASANDKYYFNDDFSSEAVTKGVTYRYNVSGSVAYNSAKKNINFTKSHSAMVLEAVSTDANNQLVDVAQTWTDYTVEAEFDRSKAPSSSHMVGILGRITKNNFGAYSYYIIMIKGKSTGATDPDSVADPEDKDKDALTVQIYKVTNAVGPTAGTGSGISLISRATVENVAEETFGAAEQDRVKLSVAFSGNTIKCYIDGDTEPTAEYVDDKGIMGEALLKGSVGIYKQADWNADVYSLKVSLPNGTPLFDDDLADDRYFKGVTNQWSVAGDPPAVHEVHYQWNDDMVEASNAITGTIHDGTYHVESVTNSKYVLLDIKKDGADASRLWTDYTVEADINRKKTNSDAVCPALMGRVQSVTDDEGKLIGYLYYRAEVRNKMLAIKKAYIQETEGEGGAITKSQGSQVVSSTTLSKDVLYGQVVHLTLNMEGSTVKASLEYKDAQGNPQTISATYQDDGKYGPALTCGTIGMENYGATSEGNKLDCRYDNIKVTTAAGQVAFQENFENDDNFTKGCTEMLLTNAVARQESVTTTTTTWQTAGTVERKDSEDPAVGGHLELSQKQSAAILKQTDEDGKDLSSEWKDYTIETRFSRSQSTAATAYAGILGRVSKDETTGKYSYYAIMLRGSSQSQNATEKDKVGVQFYKVVGVDNFNYYLPGQIYSDETKQHQVGGGFGSSSYNAAEGTANDEWLDVRVEFKGNTVTCYIKGENDADYTKVAAYVDDGMKLGDALTHGTAGIHKQYDGNKWSAFADNFKVTLPDGTVAYQDDFYNPDTLTGEKVNRQVVYKIPGVEITDTYYQWECSKQNPASSIQGGKWNVSSQEEKLDFMLNATKAVDGKTADAGELWTDYTVEMDVTRNETGSGKGVSLMTRVSKNSEGKYSWYRVYLHNTIIYVFKQVNGEETKLAETKGAAPFGTVNNLAVTVEGGTISVKLTYTDSDGEKTVTLSYTDTQDALLSGGIGVRFYGSNAPGNKLEATIGKVQVTLADGTMAFQDDFDDDSVFTAGKKGLHVNYSSTYPVDVEYGWSYSSDKKVTLVENDGSEAPEETGLLKIENSSAVVTAASAGDGMDVTQFWTDYSVKARINRSQAPSQSHMTGILGRISKSGTVYSYYAVMIKGKSQHTENSAADADTLTVQLYKVTEGQTTTVSLSGTNIVKQVSSAPATVGMPGETWIDVEVKFVGNTIQCYIGNELVLEHEDTEAPLTCGTAGLYTQASSWSSYADSFSVTLAGEETPAFEDDFAAATPKTQTKADAFMTNQWTVGDSVYHAAAQGKYPSFIASASGTTEYAENWKDYAVDMDVILKTGGPDHYASVLAYVSGGKYYELRLSTQKTELYYVDEDGETLLCTSTEALAPNQWSFVKLIVEDGKVRAVLDLQNVFTEDTATAVMNGVTFDADGYVTIPEGYILTSGTAGINVNGIAKFDNVVVYAKQLSQDVQYGHYAFVGSDPVELDSNWVISTMDNWKLSDRLTYTADQGSGLTYLRGKCNLTNYNVEAKIVTPNTENAGAAGILGRHSAEGYYQLMLDFKKGFVLSRFDASNEETELDAISVEDLYTKHNIQILKNTQYELKLYMWKGWILGYINGQQLLLGQEAQPLTSGVAGFMGTNGAAVRTVTTTPAESYFSEPTIHAGTYINSDLEKATLVTKDGKDVWVYPDQTFALEDDPITEGEVTAELGKLPDITNYYLKLTYPDNSKTKIVALDTLIDLSKVENAGTKGQHTVDVQYGGYTIQFVYTIIDKAEIQALENDINTLYEKLNNTSWTQNDAIAVHELVRRYNNYTDTELNSFDATAKANFDALRTKLVKDYYSVSNPKKLVFEDDFDTAKNTYENHYFFTGERDNGNWYVENGVMMQYCTTDVKQPLSYNSANVMTDQKFKVTTVSVDVKFLEDYAMGGVKFNFLNGEFLEVNMTDINKLSRVMLYMNGTEQTTMHTSRPNNVTNHNPIRGFEVGKWYNLRVTIDGTTVCCYVDGYKWIEKEIKLSVTDDTYPTQGYIGLSTNENWTMYDNLEVWGEVVEVKEDEKITEKDLTSENPTVYEDDFNDEQIGNDPSHWLERSDLDDWKVAENSGSKCYQSSANLTGETQTWLHVFETDVVYQAKLIVNQKDTAPSYPVAALTARVNGDSSYIRAGYDFYMKSWFIETRYGQDFEKEVTYVPGEMQVGTAYTLKLVTKGENIALYVDGAEKVTANAGRKVSPGRVGVYAQHCQVSVDDVRLELTSGQGRVNDGVMEQYTTQAGAFGRLFQILEVKVNGKDGKPVDALIMHEDSSRFISYDKGETWQVYTGTLADGTAYGTGFGGGNSNVILLDGGQTRLNIQGYKNVYRSDDGGATYRKVGSITWPEHVTYSQPGEHLSAVELEDGKTRIFYTLGNQQKAKGDVPAQTDGVVTRTVISHVWYSDDYGETWHQAKNHPLYTSNQAVWCESHVLKITKDTTAPNGDVLKAGTLVHYSAYNTSNAMRYSLSCDNGVTWEGDYEMPDLVCGWNSMTIEQDTDGTYYMATFLNVPYCPNGFPRLRVVLLSSDDGINWKFLCDVDRWGDISDADGGFLSQAVNMYLAVTSEHVFVAFSRSEGFSPEGSHNDQVGRLYRFDKTKLDAIDENASDYRDGRDEYSVPSTTITSISLTGDPKTEYTIEEATTGSLDLTGCTVAYETYQSETGSVAVTDPQVYVNIINKKLGKDGKILPGEYTVAVDYKHFRTLYTITVKCNCAEESHTCQNSCKHIWENSACTLCGKICPAHTWNNKDGKCDICGFVCEHEADYEVRQYTVKISDDSNENSTHKYYCKTCGKAKDFTKAELHNWSGDTGNACKTCEYICAHGSNIGTGNLVYASNAEKHWKECKFCDYTEETTAAAAHKWLGDTCANCKAVCEHDFSEWKTTETTHQKICQYCKQPEADAAEHTCNWKYDAYGHQKECTICHAKVQKATHDAATTCGTPCECGYTNDHTYELKSNGTQHWQECKVCYVTKDHANHTGGTASCLERAVCDICKNPYGELKHNTNGAQGVCTGCAQKPLDESTPIKVTGSGSNNGNAVTAPGEGWVEGENTFTVKNDEGKACVVAVKNSDGTYTRLAATLQDDGSYAFTANVAADSEIAVIVAGDVNGDGKMSISDIVQMKSAMLGNTELEAEGTLAVDFNNDGRLSVSDIVKLMSAKLDKTTLDWDVKEAS